MSCRRFTVLSEDLLPTCSGGCTERVLQSGAIKQNRDEVKMPCTGPQLRRCPRLYHGCRGS